MSRFAHEHPEDWEQRLDQLTDHWDMRDKTLDRRKPVLPECPKCGWRHTGKCLPRRQS